MWGDDICLFHVMFPELNEWVFMKFGIEGVKEFAENLILNHIGPVEPQRHIKLKFLNNLKNSSYQSLSYTHTLVICYKIYSLFRCTAFISCV